MADTEKDIFAAAMAGEPAEAGTEQTTENVVEEPGEAEQSADTGGQVRDPATGKFVAKEKTNDGVKPAGEQQPAGESRPAATRSAGEQQPDHRIPLAEHLNEREKRQAAENRASTLERQLTAMNRRLDEMSKPKGEPPDLYTDPNAFISARIDPVKQQQEAMIDRFSRLMAVQTFGKPAVDAAFAELESAVSSDPAMRLEAQRIWQDEHPYGALIQWHKSRQALKEIGSDPVAYKNKLREELLNDPEFAKSVIERTRAQGGAPNGQQQARPSNITRLPPSLNRVGSAAPVHQAGDDADPSDRELFRETMRSR